MLVHELSRDCQIGLKNDGCMCCLQVSHFKYSDIDSLKEKQWEKGIPLKP